MTVSVSLSNTKEIQSHESYGRQILQLAHHIYHIAMKII
jgi:hypothetical protein